MRPKAFFITGTDTGIGKTWVTLSLMNALQSAGLKVIGMKPVASGAVRDEAGRLINDDAALLQAHGSLALPYERINPWVFEPPVSPHIAAELAGCELDIDAIAAACHALAAEADCLLVEGVGGWEVPLNRRHTVADLAQRLGYPVIMVVGLRLGCINQAVLTARAIAQTPTPWLGWVANQVERDLLYPEHNLETLKTLLNRPLIASLPWCPPDSETSPPDFSPIERNEILRLMGVSVKFPPF